MFSFYYKKGTCNNITSELIAIINVPCVFAQSSYIRLTQKKEVTKHRFHACRKTKHFLDLANKSFLELKTLNTLLETSINDH